jgi:hypothetical protein
MTRSAREVTEPAASEIGWLPFVRWSALCLLVSLAVAAAAIPLLRHFGLFDARDPDQNELSSG